MVFVKQPLYQGMAFSQVLFASFRFQRRHVTLFEVDRIAGVWFFLLTYQCVQLYNIMIYYVYM